MIAYRRFETDGENASRDNDDKAKKAVKKKKMVDEAVILAEKFPGILTVNPEVLEDGE